KLGQDLLELAAGRNPMPSVGAEVTLGIRPEHIVSATNAAQGGRFASIDADIVRVEALGAETIVTARIPGLASELLAGPGPDPDAAVGERRTLLLDRSPIHLFDAAGVRIAAHAGEP